MKYTEEKRTEMEHQLKDWWRSQPWATEELVADRIKQFHCMFDSLQAEEQKNEQG